jgi:hypothetical protein
MGVIIVPSHCLSIFKHLFASAVKNFNCFAEFFMFCLNFLSLFLPCTIPFVGQEPVSQFLYKEDLGG